MKLTINRKELLRALSAVSGIPEVLDKVQYADKYIKLVAAADGGLAIEAANYYLHVTLNVPAKVERGGSTLAKLRDFDYIVSNSTTDDLEIDTDTEKDELTVIAGFSCQTLVNCPPVARYPQALVVDPVKATSVTLNAAVLVTHLEGVTLAAARRMHDESPWQGLLGIQLMVADGLVTTVATDGRRMLWSQSSTVVDAQPIWVLIPRKAAEQLEDVLAALGETPVVVSADLNNISFTGGWLTALVRQQSGRFPDYHHGVPDSWAGELQISSGKLNNAIRQASLMTSGSLRECDLEFQDKQLVLSAHLNGAQVGKAKVTVPFESSIAGTPYHGKIASRQLIQVLQDRPADEQITLRFGAKSRAGSGSTSLMLDMGDKLRCVLQEVVSVSV